MCHSSFFANFHTVPNLVRELSVEQKACHDSRALLLIMCCAMPFSLRYCVTVCVFLLFIIALRVRFLSLTAFVHALFQYGSGLRRRAFALRCGMLACAAAMIHPVSRSLYVSMLSHTRASVFKSERRLFETRPIIISLV